MAGYNTKNLLEAKPALTVSTSAPTPAFRISYEDSSSMLIQIHAAGDPGTVVLETSYDGGTTWISAGTMQVVSAFSGGIMRVKLPAVGAATPNPIGPLGRLTTSNSVSVTAIWKTQVL